MISLILLTLETEEKRSKFETIYNEYHKRMMSIAFGITKDQYDAEEAMNIALFAIAENIDKVQVDNPHMLKSYLYKVVKNAAIDLVRDKKSDPVILYPDYSFVTLESEEIIDSLIDNEQYARIVNRIQNMPDIYRDVLVLRFLHNFSVNEIASMLRRKRSTIKTQIKRGIKMLRTELEERK
ncbi:MAG: sigma-70 family RNA polymerase sigma factor [Clostridia bacterium]|nr:sigma-70 family RNA polymerase sigma factor [Clostridia bacterium]